MRLQRAVWPVPILVLAGCVDLGGLAGEGAPDGGPSNPNDGSAIDSGRSDDGGFTLVDGGVDGGGGDAADGATTFDAGCVSGMDCVVADSLVGPIVSLSASPDGKRIYWAGSATPGIVHRYDTGDT